MQVSETGNNNGAAHKPWKGIVPGGERTQKDGTRKAGGGVAAGVGIRFHVLAEELRLKPLFEISMLRKDDGMSGKHNRWMSMVNTEAKQLQCIEDLYGIVKAQPRYKNLKEPVWSGDTSPLYVIYWLLRKLGPLAKGNSWTVDCYNDTTGKLRYQFVVYKGYSSQQVRDDWNFVGLDFLPTLKEKDEPLHDLVVDIVALVSKVNKVPLWDEDGDFSEALAEIKEGGISFVSDNIRKQVQSYTNGPADEYLKLIKRRRRTVTEQDVREKHKRYKTDSERKRMVCWWITRGLQLVKTANCIKDFEFMPGYAAKRTFCPWRQYKFIWSWHRCDVVTIKAKGLLTGRDKLDTYLPVQYSVTRPGQVVKEPGLSKWPIMLCDFMRQGHSNFIANGQWRHYYYKDIFDTPVTPAEQLLEKIELAEAQSD